MLDLFFLAILLRFLLSQDKIINFLSDAVEVD